jgi:hypothetical protein
VIAVDDKKADVRTVRAKLLSVDGDFRIGPRVSVHAVLMELSFPHETTNLIGSAAAA